MKQCARCQAENFEDLKFCSLCGKELTGKIVLDVYGSGPLPARETDVPTPTMPEERAYQHFLNAKEHISKRDLDRAVLEFEAALKLCPKDPMIQRLLQKTLEAKNKGNGAIRSSGSMAKSSGTPVLGPDLSLSNSKSPTTPLRSTQEGSKGDVTVNRAAQPRGFESYGLEPDTGNRSVPSAARSRSTDSSPSPSALLAAHASGISSKKEEPVGSKDQRPTKRSRLAELLQAKGSKEVGERQAPQTGRFLEVYSRTPALSPALMIDNRSDDGFKELAVSALMLGSFLVFGFLLLL